MPTTLVKFLLTAIRKYDLYVYVCFEVDTDAKKMMKNIMVDDQINFIFSNIIDVGKLVTAITSISEHL